MPEAILDGRGNGHKAGVTPDGSLFTANMSEHLIQRLAYNAQGLVEYIGYAEPTADDGDEVWQIRKMTYVNNRVTAINFASGTVLFDKEWDKKTDYTYS